MKKTIWIGLIFSTVILAITAGIIVHLLGDTQVEEATIKDIKEINRSQENQIVVQTVSTDDKTSPNAELSFETYYSRCGHSNIEKKSISTADVNKTEKEIEEAYPEWKIKKFTPEKISFYKEINSMCDNHYLIKSKNGYIAIYSIDDRGKEELKEETEIMTQYLPEEDIELLSKGIKANSDKELKEVLADYE